MSVYEIQDQPNALLVDAGPEEVMNRLTERVATGSRMERLGYGGTMFEIIYQDRRKLTVQKRKYNFALYLFLMLFLFVPGLIYMAVARHKPRVTTVMLSRRGSNGRTRVEVSGNDEQTQRAFLSFLRETYAS